MPSRNVQFEHDIVYHVYNRGFQKQQIFFSDEDYERFYLSLEKYLVLYPEISLFAFCFLPNHFHFLVLVHDVGDGFSAQSKLSGFFRRLQQSHAMYLKTRYDHDVIPRGQVYEGRFKCKLVDEDEYFSHVVAYVENNAVRHKLVPSSSDWPWTSSHHRQYRQDTLLVPRCLFEQDISGILYVVGCIRARIKSGLQNDPSPDSKKIKSGLEYLLGNTFK